MSWPRGLLVLLLLLLVSVGSLLWLLRPERPQRKPAPQGCPHVLGGMTEGRWAPRPPSPQERLILDAFLRTARAGHRLPPSLQPSSLHPQSPFQRPDGLCGNVTFSWLQSGYHKLLWFRALCDPKGSNPCCRDGRCQNFRPEECRCENCYDLRQDVEAELATWIPRDPTCRMPPLSRDEMCDVLGSSHVTFVGDSFVRHVYTALLLLLEEDMLYGALKPGVSEGIRKQCANVYMFTETVCRQHLHMSTSLCGGRVSASFYEYLGAHQGFKFSQIVATATRSRRSLVVAGIGIHNDYDADLVWRLYLQPGVKAKGNADWPVLLWLAPHCPGLLKTPRVPQQSRDYVRHFNDVIEARLKKVKIPVFDSWQMTDGVSSFDGAHYGLGVNVEKVRIIVRYLQELSKKGKW